MLKENSLFSKVASCNDKPSNSMIKWNIEIYLFPKTLSFTILESLGLSFYVCKEKNHSRRKSYTTLNL
ncbi:hypothetical protein GLYMA_06G266600v4 [Glycine max]|uniref:Uncharacterized protein n=1 Tax=Glycine max TaxID=3847 RepID=A0A0R0JLX7_SOYBN|nr:hypothetical protein GYH30_016382 [Glycine max]KRH55614.1 hypothetical protein GLYMA_06G266600v4 [Glycine max]